MPGSGGVETERQAGLGLRIQGWDLAGVSVVSTELSQKRRLVRVKANATQEGRRERGREPWILLDENSAFDQSHCGGIAGVKTASAGTNSVVSVGSGHPVAQRLPSMCGVLGSTSTTK